MAGAVDQRRGKGAILQWSTEARPFCSNRLSGALYFTQRAEGDRGRVGTSTKHPAQRLGIGSGEAARRWQLPGRTLKQTGRTVPRPRG